MRDSTGHSHKLAESHFSCADRQKVSLPDHPSSESEAIRLLERNHSLCIVAKKRKSAYQSVPSSRKSGKGNAKKCVLPSRVRRWSLSSKTGQRVRHGCRSPFSPSEISQGCPSTIAYPRGCRGSTEVASRYGKRQQMISL